MAKATAAPAPRARAKVETKKEEATDKRRVPRVVLLARVAHEKGKPLEVENASAHGLLLRGAAKEHPTLTAGSEIDLALEPSDHGSKPVKFKARLVRVTYGEATRFGLEITSIADEARYYELLALAHLKAASK